MAAGRVQLKDLAVQVVQEVLGETVIVSLTEIKQQEERIQSDTWLKFLLI